uniref:Uncharacterized protein n=1 Tax=Lactuca sativa TaxID=4236 RepID=A0A9R1XA82_LACSA|nr:hypothetical protein LSAT_V11C600326840 [Lactuca sativa]
MKRWTKDVISLNYHLSSDRSDEEDEEVTKLRSSFWKTECTGFLARTTIKPETKARLDKTESIIVRRPSLKWNFHAGRVVLNGLVFDFPEELDFISDLINKAIKFILKFISALLLDVIGDILNF